MTSGTAARPRELSPKAALALSAAKWPPAGALIALLAVSAILPERYGLLPHWVSTPLWVLVAILVATSTFAHASPTLRRLQSRATFAFLVIVSAIEVSSLWHIVALVFGKSKELRSVTLLSTALTLWTVNVVIFSLWYWPIDRGGPDQRVVGPPKRPDFLFAQGAESALPPGWTPTYVDYVFIAFNTSVAFSPSDACPLTSKAKILMMIQAGLSLVTVVVILARAVNIFE
jgi:hypothetical protein